MRKISSILLMGAVCAVALASCAPRKVINAEAISGPLSTVLDRHDAYVSADGNLLPVERETFLRSSDLIRATLQEALKEPNP